MNAAAEVLGVGPPASCVLECYSVLTRLPPPDRIAGTLARDFIATRFGEPLLTLDPDDQRVLLDQLVDRAIAGGAAYDAPSRSPRLVTGTPVQSGPSRCVGLRSAGG